MGLFDLHCDTLCEGLKDGYSLLRNGGAVDLARGGRFQPWVQAFAAWLPDDLTVSDARRRCDALLDVAERWEREEIFSIIRTPQDLRYPRSSCTALLTVENGGVLNPDAEYLRHLRGRGVRMITLTWNGDNHWGCGCFGGDRGLTAAGRRAVTTMELLGLVADVSHLNRVGFWQVAELATHPFVASHSASDEICHHPRNLTDEQFCAIRDGGGLVGLSLYPEHLGGADLETVRRHLEHFLELDGNRTLCFGADFDGMTAPPEWNGISVMNDIKQYLEQHGWSRDLLDAVFYTNARDFFLRHWEQTIRNEE